MHEALNPILILSLVTVAETRSFTLASQRLGLRQSTISQHIKRLEEQVGRQLLARSTHAVSTTPAGDVIVEMGRNVLQANARITRYLNAAAERSSLRVGASEDLAPAILPRALESFASTHPNISIELTVGLSAPLYDAFDSGRLDVIFAKRRGGDRRGEVAWREELVWVARPGLLLPVDASLPLVLYAPPSITRAAAVAALERSQRSWHVACTCVGLSALQAATAGGLGVAPHSAILIPDGLAPVEAVAGLPALDAIEFVVIGPGKHDRVASALVDIFLQQTRLSSTPGA